MLYSLQAMTRSRYSVHKGLTLTNVKVSTAKESGRLDGGNLRDPLRLQILQKVKTMGFEPMPFLTSEMIDHLKLAP